MTKQIRLQHQVSIIAIWWKPQNFKGILFLGLLLCLLGCETYQHENLKVGQSKTVAVEVLEKYVDTEVVLKRLSRHGTKVELDSLLQLTELMKNFDEEVSLVYAQEANRISIAEGQEVSQAISLYYLTLLRERQQIYGEGLEEPIVDAKMCLRLFEKENKTEWIVNVNNLLGIIFYKQSENDSALIYLNKAIELLEEVQLSEDVQLNLKGDIFFDIANVYSTVDTIKAKTFYKNSQTLYQSTDNVLGLNRLKTAMGYFFYYDLGNIEKAEEMFQQSLEYAQIYNDNKTLLDSYEGLALLKIGQFSNSKKVNKLFDALDFLKERLVHQKENKYNTYQLIGYVYQEYYENLNQNLSNKSIANIKLENLDSAIINYKKAVILAQEEGAIQIMTSIGNNIANLCELRKERFNKECNSLLGNSHAIFLNKTYNGILNSITTNLKTANKKIRKYEEREQEVIHQQRVFRNWIITGVGLILSGLIFFIIIQRLKQKRLIAKMEALRAQINPHFIANSLNAIESLVNLNKRKEASKYLVHFSRLSRHILNGSREAFVSLEEELGTLEHFLALEQLRFRDKLQYYIVIQEGVNSKLIEVPAMILQPYVENAILHGIKPKNEPGLLKINIGRENKQLVCSIEDNGIGRIKSAKIKESSILKHKSQGIQISKERLEALGKVKGAKVRIIDLEDDEGNALGTKVIIRIPLKLRK